MRKLALAVKAYFYDHKNPMSKRFLPLACAFALVLLALNGCKKETEEFQTEAISDYYPLEVGKFITYKIDSTVFVNLNTIKEVHSYVIKDIVDAQIADNLGRPSYRIRRLIRDEVDTTKWVDNASFMVTPLDKSLEYIENNLRYIKIHQPLKDDYSWKGNNYINTYSNPDYQYLDDWDYFFQNSGQPYSVDDLTFPETITINQRDEVLGNPDDKTFYFEINKSIEVYAKSIGLVYKEFLHEAWQPPNITSPGGYYEPSSYGVTLKVLSYN